MDSSFQLDSAEHERIYAKIIEPTNFLDTSSVDKPKMLIIGSQPGAGKSKLAELSMKEFADGKSLAGIVEMAKKNGYDVIIRFVAVHERYSVWGINRRYEKEKIVRGHGRYVPIEYHDDCYQKLLDSVDVVEQQKVADQIEVYNRNGIQLYSNVLVNGHWKEAPKARVAIEKERNRKLTDKESAAYVESWQRVFEYLDKRVALDDDVQRLEALAKRFINEL